MPAKPELEPLDVWYMPFVVGDWLTGVATFKMSNRQRGAFVQMLAHAWKQQASLPDDLGTLAKYADESVAWLESPEGADVLAQWPVDARDGLRRNPKQTEVYTGAIARRAAAYKKGVAGARARWGKRSTAPTPVTAEPTAPLGGDRSAPTFADAVGRFPSVVGFAAASPEHAAVLSRALTRVVESVGEASIPGFVGEVNGALQGMHTAPVTPAALAMALADWCDNCAPVNKKLLRAYFRGDRTDAAGVGTRGPRPLAPIASEGAAAAWKLE